jgi:hypothetical protein
MHRKEKEGFRAVAATLLAVGCQRVEAHNLQTQDGSSGERRRSSASMQQQHQLAQALRWIHHRIRLVLLLLWLR